MQKISYRRHRFHPNIIRQAVWLYYRFTMSYCDVEDLLAESFNVQRHLISRHTLRTFRDHAMEEWNAVTAAA